jgi:LysM repeat protein
MSTLRQTERPAVGLVEQTRYWLATRVPLLLVGVLLLGLAGVLGVLGVSAHPATAAVPHSAEPSSVATPQQPTTEAPAVSQPSADAPTRTVRLQRKDTLWSLARRHHTTVAELQSLNKLGNSTLIRAGATLLIPAGAAPAVQPAHTQAVAPAKTHRAAPDRDHGKQASPTAGVQQIAAGVFGSEYGCAANIISRESGWNVHATNPHSGAYGLAQALPGAKMARSGPNWRTDAATQLAWMREYVTSRYGGACKAWAYWQAHHWY